MMKRRVEKRICIQERRVGANAGFTLVEMMLSLVILVMMTGIVAMGIPVAQKSYEKAVVASNAQALLSTTTTELRNELGLAQDVTTNVGANGVQTLDYYLSGEGYWAKIQSPTTTQGGAGLVKTVYFGPDPTSFEEKKISQSLVSEKASTKDMYVKFDSINYSDGVFTVNGLKVYRADSTDELAAAGNNGVYKVKALMVND